MKAITIKDVIWGAYLTTKREPFPTDSQVSELAEKLDEKSKHEIVQGICEFMEEHSTPVRGRVDLLQALLLSRSAMRAPLDEWKGELEAKALKAISELVTDKFGEPPRFKKDVLK